MPGVLFIKAKIKHTRVTDTKNINVSLFDIGLKTPIRAIRLFS
jgi:hypothetical protein